MGLIEVAGISRPKKGERVSGDAWLHVPLGETALLAVIDGLGHGPGAACAAQAAVACLWELVSTSFLPPDPVALMGALHQSLQGTRGAAVGLALVDPLARQLRYVGIGNTEVWGIGKGEISAFSRPGVIGAGRLPRLVEQVCPYPPRVLLVLHSDGIVVGDRTQIPAYLSCAQVAQHLIEVAARAEDDAVVVVARAGEG